MNVADKLLVVLLIVIAIAVVYSVYRASHPSGDAHAIESLHLAEASIMMKMLRDVHADQKPHTKDESVYLTLQQSLDSLERDLPKVNRFDSYSTLSFLNRIAHHQIISRKMMAGEPVSWILQQQLEITPERPTENV